MEEEEDQQEQYLAEEGETKSGKHSMLIYRSKRNPEKCFKFSWKRTLNDCLKYVCVGCKQAKDKGNDSIVVKSIGVSGTCFLSDPEAMIHRCIDLKFTYDYLSASIQQELRLFFNFRSLLLFRSANTAVKTTGTKPTVAYANLRKKIIAKHPENSANALLKLPKKRTVMQTFAKNSKKARLANFDPLNPPEDTFVSCLSF